MWKEEVQGWLEGWWIEVEVVLAFGVSCRDSTHTCTLHHLHLFSGQGMGMTSVCERVLSGVTGQWG